MTFATTLTAFALALLASSARAGQEAPAAAPSGTAPATSAAPFASDWILKAEDNICGLRDANQLTYPATIDFEACLEATPEMKRIDEHGIDPKSAEGIQLRNAAVSRLTKACETVRKATGHCSVWKAIRHKDGRSISDLTEKVKAEL